MNKKKKVYVVVGPTASGKSDFAVNLALKLKKENKITCEIISADSKQIYKNLNIGTGKITEEETKGVPHHMLSLYDLDDDISVIRYRKDANKILKKIFEENKIPIICGGSGQYIDALIYNQTFPKVKPDKKLREELEKLTNEELFKKLKEKDVVRALNIDKNNKVRLIRAIEIIEKIGNVPPLKKPILKYETEIFLLSPKKEILKNRIEKRLEKRLKQKMLDEAKDLIKKDYKKEEIKKFGIEYIFMYEYLNKNISKEEMKNEIINKSIKYAKRQNTWNRKYKSFAHIIEVNK